MKAKRFDCVAIKRRGAEKIYKQTKEITLQQQLESWQKRTDELRRRQEEMRNKNGTTDEP